MAQSNPGTFQRPVTLRKRLHLLSARYNKPFLWLLLFVVALPFAAMFLIAGDWEGFLGVLARALDKEPQLWIVIIGAPLVLAFFWLTWRYERLILGPVGVEYRTLLRGPLSFLQTFRPDWRLEWMDIASVELRAGARVPRTKARRRELVIRTRGGQAKILDPYLWYRKPDHAGLHLRDFMGLSDERYREAVMQSPLHQALSQYGDISETSKEEEPAAATSRAGVPGGSFDLARHPGVLGLLVGLFLFGGYAVIDWFFLDPWIYLEPPPALPFLLGALFALTLGFTLGKGAPSLERGAVAVLFAAAVAAATAPALLRVNAATDPDGPRTHAYVRVGSGEYRPVGRQDLPEVTFRQPRDYWDRFQAGSRHDFVLARGRLDFWQLDMRPLRDEMRRFYQESD